MKKKFGQYVSEYFSLTYDNADNNTIRETILSGGQVRGTNLCVLMLAIFVASIGLNMNSTAVIIGAMLISPLMGGIMAVGYCIATNDLKSAFKFLSRLGLQVLISLVTSFIYFTISPISTAHSELLARTNPTIWDVLIAFFGGLAGIIGTTRKEKSNVLPGVAIATALMPPLCTAGYGVSIHSLKFFLGAMYLFFINSFFICLSTIIVLKIMHIPENVKLSHRARKRVHNQIVIMACITIIPSIYLAYNMSQESITEGHIDKYIEECFNFGNTEVIQYELDSDSKVLSVALLGQPIDDATIKSLNDKLKDYSLKDISLKVTQTETNSNTDTEKLKETIQTLISNNVDIANLKEFMNYQTTSTDTKATINYSKVSKSIRSLYPQVLNSYLGYITQYTNDGSEDVLCVILNVSVPLNDEDYSKLNSWLSVELETTDYILIQDKITIGASN